MHLAPFAIVLSILQSEKVNGPLALGDPSLGGDVSSLFVSPDGHWVVYAADQDVDQRAELYSVPLDGSAPARSLSRGLIPGSHVAIDPGSTRAVFVDTSVAPHQIYFVLIDGSAPPVRINVR